MHFKPKTIHESREVSPTRRADSPKALDPVRERIEIQRRQERTYRGSSERGTAYQRDWELRREQPVDKVLAHGSINPQDDLPYNASANYFQRTRTPAGSHYMTRSDVANRELILTDATHKAEDPVHLSDILAHDWRRALATHGTSPEEAPLASIVDRTVQNDKTLQALTHIWPGAQELRSQTKQKAASSPIVMAFARL